MPSARRPLRQVNRLTLMHKLLRRPWALPQFAQVPYEAALPIVFMHIPKTSGMALGRGLSEARAPTKTLTGFDGVLFGGFRDFDTIAPAIRRNIYLDPTALPPDAGVVAAHMAISTTTRAYRQAQFVTVLREPYSRILSHWLYWRTQSDDTLAAWGGWAQILRHARLPLSEFLGCRDVACQFDNLSVRMLLWPHRLIRDDDFLSPADDDMLLREAIGQLQRFAYSDVVENPALLSDLQKWLGRPFTYHRLNEAMRLPARFQTSFHEELSSKALDLLEARGRLDLKLWLALARERVLYQQAEKLRERTLISNVARYGTLMPSDKYSCRPE